MLRSLLRLVGRLFGQSPGPRRRGAHRERSRERLDDDLRARCRDKPAPRSCPATHPHAGPFPVQTVDSLFLWDARRAKALEVRVTFPRGTRDPSPLVVFSHGAWGSKDDYQMLTQCWASWGYVCIQPNHSDANATREDGAGTEGNRTFTDWPNRPRDVSFVLDSLIDLEHRIEGLAGAIDRTRIGVAGHSFGAGTAQLLGGALVIREGRRSRSYRDPRAQALVLISPQGRGQLHDTGSWDELTLPVLTVTGTRDKGRGGQSYEWRLEPFRQAAAGDKFALILEDGTHAMGGLDRASVHLPTLANEAQALLVLRTTLSFLNAYLKGRPGDRNSLKRPQQLTERDARGTLLVR